jgi:aldehyde dehydrogenase (NAD+)
MTVTAIAGLQPFDYDGLFIDGRWVRPSGDVSPVISPIHEGVIGHAPVGELDTAELAMAAARRAFDEGPWPQENRAVRSGTMRKLLELVIARRSKAVELMMAEMGFIRSDCEHQIGLAITQMEKFIELSARDPMKPLPVIVTPQPNGANRLGGGVVMREPIGVVAAITPYNAGFLLGLVKVVPALAAGNTTIVKPSPFTPLQSLLMAELIAELDLPPGVFNLVTGGNDVGQVLCTDKRVDMVSFTGSDQVGVQIMAQAAPTLKKVHLELGGKSALIIRHDADPMMASRMIAHSNFAQAGQGCACTTRILVDNRIRKEVVAATADYVRGWKVGDPFEQGTLMGPVIRENARQRAEMFCEKAIQEGATLVVGGARPEGLDKGFFFAPTIFDGVSNDSYLAQNEVFGPIAAVIGFDSDDEAVKIANASDFGLAGAIVSRDSGTAFLMAQKIRTGTVQINGGPGRFHPDMPFGGYKRSGLGREWGEEGYLEFTQIKSIGFPAG